MLSPGPTLDVSAYLEQNQSQRRMVTTAAGETIQAGWMSGELVVIKWRTDGSLAWQQVISPQGVYDISRLVANAQGDLYVAGSRSSRWWLQKLSGATGEPQWTYFSAEERVGKVVDLVSMPNEDVVAMGYHQYGSHRRLLVRFDASTGSKRWEQLTPLGDLLEVRGDRLAAAVDGHLWLVARTGEFEPDIELSRIAADTGLTEQSVRLIADPMNRLAPGRLLADGTNHVVLTYASSDGGETSVRIARYGTDLVPLWDIPLPGIPNAVDVNSQSQLAVSIQLYQPQTFLTQSTVMRIGSDGVADWTVIPFPAVDRSYRINDAQIDADGNVCVIGDEGTEAADGNSVFVACLGSSSGTTLWSDRWRGTGIPGHIGTLTGQAGYLSVHEDAVIATATLQNLTRDFVIRRLSRMSGFSLAAGTDQPLTGMREVLFDDLGKRSHAHDLAGGRYILADLPDSVHSGYTLLRVDAAGEQTWRIERLQVDYGSGGYAEKVGTDRAGNALVLATYRDSLGRSVGLVEKISAVDGTVQWSMETPLLPVDVAPADDDSVVLAARDVSANWVVQKIDAGGQLVWSTLLPATGQTDRLTELAVTAGGNPVILGSRLGPGLLNHIEIAMLDGADGQSLWRQEIQGIEDTHSSDMLLESGGDVIVSGFEKPRLGGSGAPLAARIDAMSGAILWMTTLSGSADDVKLHRAGNDRLVLAMGVGTLAQLGLDDGALLWRSSGYTWSGPATDLTVDHEGHVIVVSDFARHSVVKFDGRDGQFHWATNPAFMGLTDVQIGAVESVSDERLLLLGHATVDQLGRTRVAQIWLSNALYADGFEAQYPVSQ
ncbi:MAG: PQQ-binding-like beta-propeller repeat protein [Lysobacterales bacterium]